MKITLTALLASVSLLAAAAAPAGWLSMGSSPQDYDFGSDSQGSDGSRAAFIRGKSTAAATGFGTLMQTVSAEEYRGGRWRLSARLRTDDARRAQMWMRVDAPEQKINAFDNMDDRPVVGSTAWKRYEIVLDVPADSTAVAFGFLLSGTGTVWADDFRLERVPLTTPVTGKGQGQPRAPVNLDFEG